MLSKVLRSRRLTRSRYIVEASCTSIPMFLTMAVMSKKKITKMMVMRIVLRNQKNCTVKYQKRQAPMSKILIMTKIKRVAKRPSLLPNFSKKRFTANLVTALKIQSVRRFHLKMSKNSSLL